MRGSRFYFFWVRFLTPLARAFFWVRYRGTGNIPESGKFIVCSNHKSVFDPFLLAVPFRRQIRYMGKTELFERHGALARVLLYKMGAFPVNRDRGDVSSVRTSEEILNGGGVVGIFPQGRCVFGNAPFRPKAGAALIAAKTQSPVLPASIYCKGTLRPFKRITVRFGKMISCGELFAEGSSRLQVKKAASLIADRVNGLLEEKE